MIEIEFLGGARTVTGSKHLIRTSSATVLLDCGLFQGSRREAWAQNSVLPVEVEGLDAVVLSHAHIDHSGALPMLYKQGYRGPIYATPATRDLCVPMLLDAAMIQESDAGHIDRMIRRDRAPIEPAEVLYTRDDAVAVMELMIALPYRRRQLVAPGITATFLDAGHVLGSAIVVLDIDDEGERTRVAFTGDLGRHHLPILRDPEVPDGVHCLLMESTYGDRLHDPIEVAGEALAQTIQRTCQRGGKLIIPSFALERAQEIIYELKRLKGEGKIPRVPVYVDSPLTAKLTEVFKMHPDCYDREALAMLTSGDSPFEFEGLEYVSDVEASKAIDAREGPAIIISASGMCEGGRVLHHLRAHIERPENTVAIVGFQAEHTLGRRLVERREEVRIFGVPYRRAAEVVVLNGFSAHADQAGLLDFAERVRRRGKLRRVILVHGEPKAQAALREQLDERGFPTVDAPAQRDRIRL